MQGWWLRITIGAGCPPPPPQNTYTVEPPNRGHFGTAAFVLSSEVVLFSEVVYYLPCILPSMI